MLLLIPTMIMIVTNPANWQNLPLNDRRQFNKAPRTTTAKRVAGKKVITNYLLFSVEDKFDALVISALQQTWPCYYNYAGSICDWAGKCNSPCNTLAASDKDSLLKVTRFYDCWISF